MNTTINRRGLVIICAALLAPLGADALAPVSVRSSKDFRELIVRGERPEIALCMVAALGAVRSDVKFDALRWSEDDSDGANLRETEAGGELLRKVHFKAQLRLRSPALFTDAWQNGEVACEQRREAFPDVHLTTGGR